jgi:hypothetical protein
MNRLSGDQLTFLERFSRTPDARSLVEILGAELASVEKDLRTLSGDLLMRAQGKAQQLDWFINQLETKHAQPSAPLVHRRISANPLV